jgi:hypothetical protein
MYQVFNFIVTLPVIMDVMPLACTMAVTTDPFSNVLVCFSYTAMCLLVACNLMAVCYCLLIPHHTHQNSWDFICEIWNLLSSGQWCHIIWCKGTFFPTKLTFLSCSWRQHLPPKYHRSASQQTIIVISTTIRSWSFTCEGVCQTSSGTFHIFFGHLYKQECDKCRRIPQKKLTK